MSLNYINNNMLKGGSNDIAYTVLGTISLLTAIIIGLISSKDFLKKSVQETIEVKRKPIRLTMNEEKKIFSEFTTMKKDDESIIPIRQEESPRRNNSENEEKSPRDEQKEQKDQKGEPPKEPKTTELRHNDMLLMSILNKVDTSMPTIPEKKSNVNISSSNNSNILFALLLK